MAVTEFANGTFVTSITSDAHCGDGQSNDRGLLRWNSRRRDTVNACGRLVSLARTLDTLVRRLDAARRDTADWRVCESMLWSGGNNQRDSEWATSMTPPSRTTLAAKRANIA